MDSPDITVVIIRLFEQQVLVVSVYVLGEEAQALQNTCKNVYKAVAYVRRSVNTAVEVVIVGDFNWYN